MPEERERIERELQAEKDSWDANDLREAARLRALIPALESPDAMHAATALLYGCALFLTNDNGFRRILGLPFAILDDILAAP